MIILTILIALVLQITILDLIAIGWVRPNLLLIVTVFYAISGGSRRGLATGIFAGALADIFSAGPMGLNTVALGVCGYLCGYFAGVVYKDNTFTQAVMCAIAGLIYALIYLTGMAVLLRPVSLTPLFFTVSIPAIIYTTCIYPLAAKIICTGRKF